MCSVLPVEPVAWFHCVYYLRQGELSRAEVTDMNYTICLISPKGFSYGPEDINIPHSVRCVCVSEGVDTWPAESEQ